MTKIKTKEEVLRNLNLTPEEQENYDYWTQFVQTEDYDDVRDQAWEVGSEQFFREQAMANLVPLIARAIDRELRRDTEDSSNTSEKAED